MYEGFTVLAVVPARGGSKGVPRKNVRPLNGEPLIGHSLRTARDVDWIDELVVSTDDPEIAEVAGRYGVRVIDRPAELSTDAAPTEWALLHALDELEGAGRSFEVVLVLEPTSPLRSVNTIREAIRLCARGPAPSILAVRETRENLGRVEDGLFRPLNANAPRRRQLRAPLYVESSTIYAARTDFLRRTGSLACDEWGAVVVPPDEGIDINSELDFLYLESLIKQREANAWGAP